MKKSLFFAVFIIALSFAGLAQNGKISYQAVVRNSANQLVYDQDLTVTVGIANSESGTAVYTETHATHSNANGLISLLIGDGTSVSGSDWNAIQWNSAWVTAVISQGGTVLATHHLPLSAVPYALYADQVDPAALANYLTANHYLTEEVQVLSLSNDTVYLTGGSFVKLPAGFSGNYNDLTNKPDLDQYATNTHLNDTLGHYYTNTEINDTLGHYYTSDEINDTLGHYPTQQTLKDTAGAIRGDFPTVPTNVSAFTNDAGYLTSDSAVITNLNTNVSNLQTDVSNLQTDVTNLQTNVTNLQSADAALSSRITTDSSNLVNLANRVQNFNTHVCDSVKSCVTGWISDSLKAYYDTTRMKTAIHDTAEALRSIMSAAANDAKITIQKNGVEVDHFTVNQSANQDINILVPTTVAEMTDADNYVTVTKLGDTLSHYAESDTLKDYLTINGLCDSVKKCEVITTMQTNITNVTNNLDSTKTNIRNEINNKVTNLQSADAALSARITADSTRLVTTVKNLNSADSALSARITADSTNLAKNYYSKADIKDTLDNFLTINGLCDSVKKCEVVNNLQKADSLLGARIYTDSVKFTKADSALSARITADSSKLASNYYTRTQVDSADAAVRNDIGKGKLTITYANNDPVVFGANQDTNTTVNISAPVYGTLTLKKNNETGQTIGTFTANETKTISIPVPTNVADMTDADEYLKKTDLCNSIENCSNVALKNGNNAFTGNNTFSGKNTFTDTNTVEKRGFSFDTPGKTTESNCQVMVNACDLLAVFDSLAKRMDNLSKRFDSLQKSNDSLAEELDSLKKSTMASLALSSDKSLDTCVVEGSVVEIAYRATLLRTDGAFNYKWYVNGSFLREGTTKDTIHLTTDTAGVIKVLCVATATSGPTVLKDSLTTKLSAKSVFDYTVLGGNSADFGRIRIDSSTAISAVWKDEDGNEIGTWNSGLTETLPVGEYTVVLSGGCEPDTVKIDVLASPMCLVGSLNETETIGSYTFNVEEGVTKYGRQYVTQIYDLEDNLYNVVDIGGVCWTRENMRSTIYSKNSKFYPIYDGLSDYTHGPGAPYLFEKSDPQINGYLYTKSAAAAGVYSYPTDYNAYIRGICPDGWHLPSYNDVSVMLDATGARSNAGKLAGALTSAADTSWTECNTVTSATGNYDYAERNSTGFSAIRSGYIDASYLDTEPFNDNGAYFWVSRQHDNTNYPTWYSFVLRIPDGCSKDIDFGEDAFASDIYNALSVRCVRDMQPSLSISSSEGNNVSSCGSLSVPVMFTAKIHNDDADGYQYSWNGAAATSSNTFSASYSSSGNYTVSCTATKGEMTFTATYKIKVGCVGIDTCIYNLTVTVVGTMGSPTTIDWGDGQTTNGVAVNSTFHTYGTAGTYNIQVSDNDGNIETFTATVSKPHTTCNLADITTSNAAALANEYSSSAGIIDSVSDHEGNWYEVVRIGSQCWLKENMRCTTSPSTPNKYIVYKPTSADDHTVILSYASKIAHWYNNDSTFYVPKDYGLLYNWCAAMDTFNVNYPEVATQSDTTGAWACTFDGHRRGICPAGWHVPTTQEWTVMESFVNGSELYPYHQAGEYRGTHAAKLSSSCDWNDMYADGHGSVDPKTPGDYSNPERNSSGFSALPAGTWNYLNGGEFTNGATASGRDGLYAMFWTSSNDIAPNDSVRFAVERKIMNAATEVQAYNYAKYHGHSVRCVRD